MPAYLVLETGDVFAGEWIGQPVTTNGDIVIHTGMTGYQDVIADPAYGGQIVVFTYPLIGNSGALPTIGETKRPQLSAVVMSEYCTYPSPYGPSEPLAEQLDRWGIPGLSGIDTRSLAATVRRMGSVRGIVSSEPRLPERVEWLDRTSFDLLRNATEQEPVTYPGEPGGAHIVVIDFGRKPSLLRTLQRYGCSVTVVPFNCVLDEIVALSPDGLVLSNGPGVPEALSMYAQTLRPLLEGLPTLAIGLGHLVSAIAFGAQVRRLPSGHHGNSYPVKQVRTGQVWMTSQNQTYAVVRDSIDTTEWDIDYVNVYDGTVEGLTHRQYPLVSVKFYPDGQPGPSDTEHIIQSFITSVNSQRKETAYA